MPLLPPGVEPLAKLPLVLSLIGASGPLALWRKKKLSGIASAVSAVVSVLFAQCFGQVFRIISPLQLSLRTVLNLGSKLDPWPLELWLAKYSEEAIDPDRPIIDAHHHLWDARIHPKGWPLARWQIRVLFLRRTADIAETSLAYHRMLGLWAMMNSFGHRQILFDMPYMGEELSNDINNNASGKRGHNVVGTVYLECGWHDMTVEEAVRPVGEAVMVQEVHKRFPNIGNGIVAYANLKLPDVEKALQAYSLMPSVKGIRHSLAWTPDTAICGAGVPQHAAQEPEFRRGFALLEKYGLSYDVWMFHEQLEDVTDLVKTFPGTTIIIDHVANPLGISTYNREEVFPIWEKGFRGLAAASSENVYVKLSGLAMCNCGFNFDKREQPPTSQELADAWRPYFKVALEAFGVRRCMFASNFAVDKCTCDYTILWNAFKIIVADYSEADKNALFYENAKRVYRL
eukprot:gnl/TRDRNA2_/TRDRNA2_202436_c0_seq1.p1 gnl/TRDRNA2_/TRDRNA2_202436_c0~~gnl/TRDRNA2_/TRDRNA2_202436_c0_seq1.p1  ORF type:complete len:457 (+),score=84.52 gnl/TRDRNA2_/TRDRNA2_202436_c0_seq1:51-1421(+)